MSKWIKIYDHVKTCTWIFITLLMIFQNWKQQTCPLLGECINKLWYIHKMEHFLVIKKNEILKYKMMWWNIKSILLSERSQPEKAIYYMIPATWHSEKGKTVEKIKRSVVAIGFEMDRSDKQMNHRVCLGQWNYYTWHHSVENMTYICQKP